MATPGAARDRGIARVAALDEVVRRADIDANVQESTTRPGKGAHVHADDHRISRPTFLGTRTAV
jgi:hypothetical protein